MTSVNIHWKREVGSCPECREFFDISLIFDNKCPICDSYVDESNIVVTKIPATSAISEERIAGATIISGKNQPFGCVQLYLTKNIFSTDEEGKWDALDVENVDVENVNYRPSIEVGVSTVDVEAYGEVKGYIISNVSTDDDHTIIIAYHPAYRLSHTLISSVFSNLLTVNSVFDNYATFNVGLEGYPNPEEEEEEYSIPNDWYRADSNRGCQSTYNSGFSNNTDNLNSEYKATGSSMINLSKYTSGRGYLGTSDSAKNKYTFWYQKDFVNLIFHIIVEDISEPDSEEEDKKYVRTIEWVEGRPDDIIRFIVKEALNMDIYPQYFSDPKTYYPNPDSSSIKDDVYSDYTEEVLERALAKGTKSMNATDDVFGTPIGDPKDGDYTDRLRIRVNASITCGGLIDSIANLTNRKYSFSGEGFFMTDNVPNSSATEYTRGVDGTVSKSKDPVKINTTEGLLLDFDGEKVEDFNETPVKAEPVSQSPEIQDNMDSIVISSQSVESENYAVNIPNTSAVGSKEGTRIILPIVDMGDDSTSNFNSYRNRMTKLCAYNTLVRRFKYDTNISYHFSELTYEGPTADKICTDYAKYVALKESEDNDTEYNTILYDDGIVAEKCKWSGKEWEIVNLTEDTGITPRYSSNAFVKEIRDNFNGLVIKDVPLAYIIRSYPEYMTELVWGRAPTNDLSAHIKQQESESVSNSTSGNEDTGISNKYSSKLVVGNMTQKQLAENNDTRAGYTGLIMEKNIGSELYRLAGYDRGVVQAEFDTRGRISAGAGTVILDEDGLKLEDGGVSLGNDGLIFTDESHGTVELDSKGMVLTDTEGVKQLIIDGKGIHDGKGLLYINDNGLTYSDVLVASENAFHIKAHQKDRYEMSVDIQGEINISDKKIDGGGVTLSNEGLILEDEVTGSIILSNVNLYGSTHSKGLVALDPDGKEQFSLTGMGLKLQETEYNSMFMDSSGLSFEDTNPYDEDGTTPRKKSLIYMNASALTFSQWMNIDNNKGYYEQVKLDGRGLSIHNDAIIIDRQGFRANGVTINETGITIDRGGVSLNEDGLSFDQGVKLTSDGLSAGEGVLLSDEGLRLEKETLGLITLDHLGMYIYGPKEEGEYPLRLIIDGKGVRDKYNKFLIDDDGLTVTDKYSETPFLKLNEDGFSLNAEHEHLSESLFNVKGQISIDENQIDGGGVTLSKRGLEMEDGANSIVLANTEAVQGLIASKDDVVQLSLTGEGLSLPGNGDDENPESMKLDRGGITFKKGKDDKKDSSIIKMTAGELQFSKYMELLDDEGEVISAGYYDQLQIDGGGLSVAGDLVTLNGAGLYFEKGGVTLNDAGFSAEGIRLNDQGLTLHKTIEGEEIRIAQMTSDGLAFVSEEKDGDDVIYNPLIKLGSEGLVAGTLTINGDGLTTTQGGVKISPDGIDTIVDDNGVKLNQDGLSLYSKSTAVSNSTLKFIKGGGTEVTMGTISSGRSTIHVPNQTTGVTGGTFQKETYATIIDGQSSDGGDSTLILRSTPKGLKDNAVIKSPQMSNKGVPMYLEYTSPVILGEDPDGIDGNDGISSISSLGDTLMGYDSTKFPLGIYDTPRATNLEVTVKIKQPCSYVNWKYIEYYSVDVNIGGASRRYNIHSSVRTPTKSSRVFSFNISGLKGVKLGNTVSVKLNYGSTNDSLWFLFNSCRPSIIVTKVQFLRGGITTTQNATLPAPFNNVQFSYAYWSGSFVELSHTYENEITMTSNTSKSIDFKVYRDSTYTNIARTISTGGTVKITPSSRTGMYNAQYKMGMNSIHTPANLEVKMDAKYTAPNAGGGHIYLRPDGNYLRGNTEIRGGDNARLSIRSDEGTWGATGIDFHDSNVNFNDNSNVDFNKAKLDGSPVLTESFINSIRNNLGIYSEYRGGLSRTGATWYLPVISSRVNIVMIKQNHQNLRVRVWPNANTPNLNTNPDAGLELVHLYDKNNGDGNASATVVVPIGYRYVIVTHRSDIVAYEFPLRI